MAAIPLTSDIDSSNTGSLQNNDVKKTRLLNNLLLPEPVFEIHRRYSAARTTAENYIAGHFNTIYGARVCSFLPLLMTMRCRSEYSAAIGIRSAARSELFLEQYLESPIEQVISQSSGKTAHRNEIVEIGNLVATSKGTSHLLFILVAAALIRTENRWMVFTATEQVAKILRRLNFSTITLCEADKNKLNSTDKDDQWGKYYNSHPQVLAGDLSQAYDLIHNNRLIKFVVRHYADVVNMLVIELTRQHL